MRIAIQGARASFHDLAAKQWFGSSIEIVPCDTFSEVFGSLNRHNADAALVAIENSLYGSINQVYDLIETHGYPIIGEVQLPVHQQLIGTAGQKPTLIYSHPVALAQCEDFLNSNYPEAKRIEYHDTAAAVEFIKEAGDSHMAAIASDAAATMHDMAIIAPDIEDNKANFTRFLAIKPNGQPPHNANRTSLVLTTTHTPGALAKILTVFAEAGINLAKLQSRPIIGHPWQYRFYIVLDAAATALHQAVKQARPLCTELRILGEYYHSPEDV